MDTLPTFTTLAVDATSPKRCIANHELPAKDILEVIEYHGTAGAYSSDDDVFLSDHPSEDSADLALAVRDESFAHVPLMLGKTYSSSGESFGVYEVEGVEEATEESANSVHRPQHSKLCWYDEYSSSGREGDGYASVEDSLGNIERARKFDVMDPVPTSRAQELFLMAWNGESSSCGEDAGDIETIPSDSETIDMEDDAGQNDGEVGSVHTLESSSEATGNEEECGIASHGTNPAPTSAALEDVKAETALRVNGNPTIETAASFNRCITSHVIHLSDGSATSSSADHSPRGETKDDFVRKTSTFVGCEVNETGEACSEYGSNPNRTCSNKSSASRKRNVLKLFTKLFARCIGRD